MSLPIPGEVKERSPYDGPAEGQKPATSVSENGRDLENIAKDGGLCARAAIGEDGPVRGPERPRLVLGAWCQRAAQMQARQSSQDTRLHKCGERHEREGRVARRYTGGARHNQRATAGAWHWVQVQTKRDKRCSPYVSRTKLDHQTQIPATKFKKMHLYGKMGIENLAI